MRLVNYSDLDRDTKEIMDWFPGELEEPYRSVVMPFVTAVKTIVRAPSLDRLERHDFLTGCQDLLEASVVPALIADKDIGDWL